MSVKTFTGRPPAIRHKHVIKMFISTATEGEVVTAECVVAFRIYSLCT